MNTRAIPTIDEMARPDRRPAVRFGLLATALLVVTAVLAGRSFYLQIFKGAALRSRAEYNRVAPQILPAPRGIFYDTHGQQLVENIASTDLILDPALLPAVEDEGYLVDALPGLLPYLKGDDIQAALHRCRTQQRPALLAKALDHETVLAIEAAQAQLPGVRLVSSLVRQYPYGEVAAHVLGYTSAVTSEQLEADKNLVPTDTTGKAGLEETYDRALRGTHGVEYTEVNAAGRPLNRASRQEPAAGEDIHLTLDIELQKYVYSLFSDRHSQSAKTVAGAVAVLDPRDGSVLALVSYPAFDPNLFSQPSLAGKAGQFLTDSRQPLFNRAVDGTYPSGSVIKPFIAAGGLQEGVITDKTTVLSTGGLTVGPWHFLDWKAGGHGVTDLKKAIAESVNTFFYLLAGGDETHTGLGVAKLGKYLKEFGWGLPTHIDLPSEAAGFIPNPAWKEATFGEPWYIGDTYHLGIGQGNVLVTPLQIARATAALANGGRLYEPHLKQLPHPNGGLIPIEARHIKTIQEAMRQAVTEGSGRSLSALPVALAGKTGTAQIGGTDNTDAWFTSFGPWESPQLVVTVLLEQGGAGDRDAAPLAKAIWQWWLDHRKN